MEQALDLIEEKNIILQEDLNSKQTQFLQSCLGMVINNAVDIGIKAALPDLIEDEVIHIKNSMLENGLKEGINETVRTAIDFGKTAIGIVTGKFDNINQIEMAVRKGGMIDAFSDLLDSTIEKANNKNLINKTTANLMKKEKNTILKSVNDKIENTLETQVKNVEKLKTYSDKWKVAYNNQDFNSMTKNYKNIQKYLKQTIPLENTINDARKIENLHNLIKNNGEKFNLTDEEKMLAEKLVN